jgi:hypothetical protein
MHDASPSVKEERVNEKNGPLEQLGTLTKGERKSIDDISSLAQRIFVRAVVNTGELAGVTTGHESGTPSLDATRTMHKREAMLAFQAASAFYEVQAEWMVQIVQAQRGPVEAPAPPPAPERVAAVPVDPLSAPERASIVVHGQELAR